MRIDAVTIFPDYFAPMQLSLLGKAQGQGILEINIHDLRSFTTDNHHTVDDTPYGGGAGMIIQCEPVFACIEALKNERTYDEVIYLCPDGEVLTQSTCNSLSLATNLILLCGHYKGIDQRIRDVLVTREISIGDYVVTGGEIAAGVLTDAIVRLIPGVVSDAESVLDDSFMHGLLDAPMYTKPAVFREMSVPDVLLSGNHAHIRAWRQEQSLAKTTQRRPDLVMKDGET